MPNWKKLLVSGSDANLSSLSVDSSISAASITGSLLSTNGIISSSAQVVASLNNQDIDLGTGDITAVTASIDYALVNDTLQGNGSGFQFFAYNEDTVKVKFANWYSSNDRQYGMGQLWFETWFAAIDNQAQRGNRRIGFYLEEPDAGSPDSGTPGQHPSNARFYVDVNGAYLSGSLNVEQSITGSEISANLIGTASYADFATTASIALSGDGIFSGSFSGSFEGDLQATNITASNLLVNGNAQFVNVLGVANEIVMVGSNNSITSSAIISLDPTNNYLGINQPNPEVTLHMTGDGAQTAQIRMEQYNDSSDAPDIRTRKARGTSALPSKNDAGDFIYRQNSERYNGSTYTTVGQFAVDSTGSADRFRLTLAVSEDGNTIDAADAQFMIDGNNGGAIKFNDSYYFPTSDGTNGQALITNGSGSLSFGTVSNATSASYAVSASHVEFADNTRNAVSASYAVTASYAVSASVEIIKEVSSSYADTASIALSGDGIFSGSFSGSFEGDGSNLTGVGAFPYTGSAGITGSLNLTGNANIIGGANFDVFATPQTASGDSIIPDGYYAKMFGPVLVSGTVTVGVGSILKVEPF